MAAPPPHLSATNMMVPPPLPPGWTEHIAPGGQPYYYNAATKQSTYVRPLPAFPVSPFSAGVAPLQPSAPADAKEKKKEKPKVKTPVPGTPWLRVITNAGHVFYTNTERKESVWTVPDEIKDAVAELEREERQKEELERQKKQLEEEEHKRAVEKEVERLRNEVEVDVAAKRKAAEPELLEEVVVSKRARVEDAEEDDDDKENEDDSDEDEEDWQREAAAQLAAEAEAEKRRRKEEEEARKREEEEELRRKEKEKGNLAINMPNRVDLSVEEAKALFKTLLHEKDIDPLLPWDTALPQFVRDPRYVLLPSVSARKEAFDEYCRDRARELRQAKLAAQNTAADEKKDPKGEFDKLLREEVKSTRTSWTEWRRTWKKERRFYGWGRDDREREKRFRDWLKELGEQKRKAAEKAEADFFILLKEKAQVTEMSSWKDVKRGLDKDARYDAVGSSSLREELFNTYKKTLLGGASLPSNSNRTDASEGNADDRRRKDKERKERAVREREEQVKRERERMEAEMARSRKALTREESELEFMTLLTDAIREPTATWNSSLKQLKTDPRFTHSALPGHVQQSLFHKHVSALRNKQIAALHALLEAHAPSLNTGFSELPLISIQASVPAQKLRLDKDSDALEREYGEWRHARVVQAEREFQDMLNENSFVEFWGRVRKMREGSEGSMKVEIGAEDLPGEEDESGKIDLKALAKNVDVHEIERVLKNDRRYTIFDHIPDQRETWIRAHIEKLAAPKLSVHVPEHGH